jgi:hypothetical protein
MKIIETIELANVVGGAGTAVTEMQEANTAVNVLGCYAQAKGATLPAGVTNPCDNLYPGTANAIRSSVQR